MLTTCVTTNLFHGCERNYLASKAIDFSKNIIDLTKKLDIRFCLSILALGLIMPYLRSVEFPNQRKTAEANLVATLRSHDVRYPLQQSPRISAFHNTNKPRYSLRSELLGGDNSLGEWQTSVGRS